MNLPLAWRELVADVNEYSLTERELLANVYGTTLLGACGVRDPDALCTAFETGNPLMWNGDCETDGHYLCNECRKRKTCPGCQERPSHCSCPPEAP